jgi:hypothetical protein
MNAKNLAKKILYKVLESRRKNQFFSAQKNEFGLDKKTLRKAKRLGFTAEEYIIFDLAHNNPREYLSEYERYKFRDSVKNYRILLDNKIVFYSIIKNFAPVNKIYAYKTAGKFVALEEKFSAEKIRERLEESGEIVYKKTNRGGGSGFFLRSSAGGKFFINRNSASFAEIQKLLDEDDFLLEEFCQQGEFENSIWNRSVNTLRIVTIFDDGEISVAAAVHRFGVDEKKCVDNACAGGIYCEVDLETGELSAAISKSAELHYDENKKIRLFCEHPVSHSKIKGVRIPGWEKLLSEIKILHEKILFTGIHFIAWDIALTNSGWKVIEANTSCSMNLLQIFCGARNKKVGIWLLSHI